MSKNITVIINRALALHVQKKYSEEVGVALNVRQTVERALGKELSPKPRRRPGTINSHPDDDLPAWNFEPAKTQGDIKPGTKLAELFEALEDGGTADDFKKVCIKKDGTPWAHDSIPGLVGDLKKKGYGLKSDLDKSSGRRIYFIVPERV